MSVNIKDSTKDNNLQLVSGRTADDRYSYSDALTLEEIDACPPELLGNKIPKAETVKVLNNKFKQNIYSKAQPQIVGEYNSKPLYRKYIETTVSGSGTIAKDISSLCPSNYDHIHLGCGSQAIMGTQVFDINSKWGGFYKIGDSIFIQFNWSSSSLTYTLALWIEYTLKD